MTTPTSSIASVPVTIPSPPNPMQEGGLDTPPILVGVGQLVTVLVRIIWFNTLPLPVGVVMTRQLVMILVMVLVGIILRQPSVLGNCEGRRLIDGGKGSGGRGIYKTKRQYY